MDRIFYPDKYLYHYADQTAPLTVSIEPGMSVRRFFVYKKSWVRDQHENHGPSSSWNINLLKIKQNDSSK